MYLPTLSWEEHCALLKEQGNDLASMQKPNFECWMRERAALNKALLALDNISSHSAGMVKEIQNYISRLESNQDELSASFLDRGKG